MTDETLHDRVRGVLIDLLKLRFGERHRVCFVQEIPDKKQHDIPETR